MPCANHPEVDTGLFRCYRCQRYYCGDCLVDIRGQMLCAVCKTEQVRDIQSGSDKSQLELAGRLTRFVAQIVDGLIIGLPIFLLVFFLTRQVTLQGGLGVRFLIGIAASIPHLLYEALMLQSRGQTLGKMAMKIKVVTPEGHDISPGQAWGRALSRFLFQSYLALINVLPILFTKQRTCIHDLIARTRVVKLGI